MSDTLSKSDRQEIFNNNQKSEAEKFTNQQNLKIILSFLFGLAIFGILFLATTTSLLVSSLTAATVSALFLGTTIIERTAFTTDEKTDKESFEKNQDIVYKQNPVPPKTANKNPKQTTESTKVGKNK